MNLCLYIVIKYLNTGIIIIKSRQLVSIAKQARHQFNTFFIMNQNIIKIVVLVQVNHY